MKKIILSTFFSSIFLLLTAQEEIGTKTIHWGEKYNSTAPILGIASNDSESFVIARNKTSLLNRKTSKITLEKYNYKGTLLKKQKVKLVFKKKKLEFKRIIDFGDNLWTLSTFYNRAKKTSFLFAQRINNSLKLSKKLIKIGEASSRGLSSNNYFDINYSVDSSHIIISSIPETKNNDKQKVRFEVFNTEFERINDKEVELPFKSKSFSYVSSQVDTKGNAYIMGHTYERIKLLKRDPNEDKYVIVAFYKDERKYKIFKISLKAKFISDMTFKIMRNGNIVCSGFYSDKDTRFIKGTYYMVIDGETKEVITKSTKEFDFDLRTHDFGRFGKKIAERAEKTGKKKSELYKYNLDHLVLRADGGAISVAEQFYVTQESVPSYGANGYVTYHTRITYHYNDILITNINPDGSIAWTKIINKNQSSSAKNSHVSYSLGVSLDKINIIYNGTERIDGNNKKKLFSKNVMVLRSFNLEGEEETNLLSSKKEAKVTIIPSLCRHITSNRMIVCGSSGSRYKFGYIDLD